MIVMDLEQGDEMISVGQADDTSDVIMVSEQGQAIKFAVSGLTPRSRSAGGVRGLRLIGKDRLVAMGIAAPNTHLLIVSRNGYGKSTPLSSYPRHKRGGQGVRTFRVTDKAGPVAAARVVPDTPGQEIFIISSKAQMQRITLEDVRVTGRNTQGVIVWRERETDDFVAAIACFHESDRKLGDNGADGASNGSAKDPANGTSGNGTSNGHRTANGSSDEK